MNISATFHPQAGDDDPGHVRDFDLWHHGI